MQTPAATIICPNYTCEAPNPEHNKYCEKCRTPLPKRYLWVVGKGIKKVKELQIGETIADRYVFQGDRILLDTQPGKVPDMPMEIPDSMVPYLRLFTHRLYIPQVYGQLVDEKITNSDLWLLEQGPIYSDTTTESADEASAANAPQPGKLMPPLIAQWAKASPLRQLNWLWQIAKLWQPLIGEGVAGSLLYPELIRVEGPIVRLSELRIDANFPKLSDLGKLWLEWVPTANPLIAPFLKKLCQLSIEEKIQTSDQLIALLDRGLNLCGQLLEREYAIATGSDQGPSRRRNEDACYPKEGNTKLTNEPGFNSLAIVCDGIGGHEGGNVASNMAIDAVKNYIQQQQKSTANFNPQTLSVSLESAAAVANQEISDKNDSQQKQGRQRMGTTLVMSYAHAHELYLTHVGDSRAYWINQTGCRQVTIDDDVASRHVCFGYVLYRDALQQPSSGSLVQALGMGPSSHLHPTVERLIIDEDCLFLLCSDGLSDNDRVEQYWDTKILPALNSDLSLSQGVNHLIDLANYYNGHDNVTVALVRCRVTANENVNITAEALVAQLDEIPRPLSDPDANPDADTKLPKQEVSASAPTKLVHPKKPSLLLPLLLTLLAIAAVVAGGILAINSGVLPNNLNSSNSENNSENNSTNNLENNSTNVQNVTDSQLSWDTLEPGAFYQIKEINRTASQPTLKLYKNDGTLEELQPLSVDSVVLVQKLDSSQKLAEIEVCSRGEETSSSIQELGLIRFEELERSQMTLEKDDSLVNNGKCDQKNDRETSATENSNEDSSATGE